MTKVAGAISERLPVSSGVLCSWAVAFSAALPEHSACYSAATALFADDTLLYEDDCKGAACDPCCGLQTALTELSSCAD